MDSLGEEGDHISDENRLSEHNLIHRHGYDPSRMVLVGLNRCRQIDLG